jgi:hypothetical protein
MGLCFKTSTWTDRLWSEHLDMSAPARELVAAGIRKQGASFAGFPADLHARLYLPSDPCQLDGPSWASLLHAQATELGEWRRLKSMCARNGFAAGVATEAMLAELLPFVPDSPKVTPESDGGSIAAASEDSSQASGQCSRVPSDGDVRAALRRATRQARDAVQQAESQLEGVATPLGFSKPGSSTGQIGNPANIKAIRDAHSRLQSSRRLQRIAELAGRLERIAAAKARSRIDPGVGEVHGIELGDHLSRLLPSELLAFRHPRLRLALLSRLIEHRALTYGMTGREPQARGPIVVLLDESSSMRERGKDVWSKAVCLALLSAATNQRRAWHLVAFNGGLRREVEVPAGQATAPLIEHALDHRCSGGTDFNLPIIRAAEVIRCSKTMKKADVVIITDGEASLSLDTVEAATVLTRTEGVSWFVVGVGPDAETYLRCLEPIATSMVVVRDTGDAEPIVPVINLDRTANGCRSAT